ERRACRIPHVSLSRSFAMLCRHCQRVKSNRPRGLCWSCYYTPGVRDLYPSTSKFARRGVGNFNGRSKLPPCPTDALPGTPEKVGGGGGGGRGGRAPVPPAGRGRRGHRAAAPGRLNGPPGGNGAAGGTRAAGVAVSFLTPPRTRPYHSSWVNLNSRAEADTMR